MRRARLCWTRRTTLLLVANDKGIGTTNTDLTDNCATYYGVCGFNSHQDQGTVSIVPIPGSAMLAQDTAAGLSRTITGICG